MNELDGKVALITGATSGIGQAIATHFANSGARLLLTGRNVVAGVELAATLGARFLPGDITDPELPDRLVAAATPATPELDDLRRFRAGLHTSAAWMLRGAAPRRGPIRSPTGTPGSPDSGSPDLIVP